MAMQTPAELRAKAAEFRRLAAEGEDQRLQAALLLVAAEFDEEADRAEAEATAKPPGEAPPDISGS